MVAYHKGKATDPVSYFAAPQNQDLHQPDARSLALAQSAISHHNAHHRAIHCPWYLLPQIDAELYNSGYRQHVTLDRLVKNYHQFRIYRLFHGGGTVVDRTIGASLFPKACANKICASKSDLMHN